MLNQMGQLTVNIDYDVLKFQTSCTSGNNALAVMVNIPSYTCPSASLPGNRPGGYGYATYRGCVGNSIVDPNDSTASINHPGIFDANSSVGFRDITDGDSNTIMFGESLYGFWGDPYSCCARVRHNQAPFDAYWTSSPNNQQQSPPPIQYFGFGSWHADVCHFGLADGSTRSISKVIDFTILNALATRNNGERISADF